MTKFLQSCRDVAVSLGIESPSISFEDTPQKPFHDDGFLHISDAGFHISFDVGQDDGKKANERTRAIMKALKLEVTDRVLAEEEPDEEDECPHCGRRH